MIAAFGEHLSKTRVVPKEFHRDLIRGMQVRHAGDYGKAQSVTATEAVVQIGLAEKFLTLAAERLGPLPPIPEG